MGVGRTAKWVCKVSENKTQDHTRRNSGKEISSERGSTNERDQDGATRNATRQTNVFGIVDIDWCGVQRDLTLVEVVFTDNPETHKRNNLSPHPCYFLFTTRISLTPNCSTSFTASF